MGVPTIQLGPGGPVFSRVVFGAMRWGSWGHRLSAKDMERLIAQSIALGITTFDHADIYGGYTTEAAFGKALHLQPSLRHDIQLVTKCGIKMPAEQRPGYRLKSYDTSRAHIIDSAERSLSNLHTDYLDLLLIHRPSPLLHPDEVAAAFRHLQEAGKVRHFGVSNFTPSQFELLHSRFPLVTNQIEASALHLPPFHDGTIDQALRLGLPPMAWSPLGGGALFQAVPEEREQRLLSTLQPMAKRLSIGIDQLLIAWLLHHPAQILPVLGTARIERAAAAAEACKVKLSDEDWFGIWQAAAGQEVP